MMSCRKVCTVCEEDTEISEKDFLQDKVHIGREREFLGFRVGVVTRGATRRGVTAVWEGEPPAVKADQTHGYRHSGLTLCTQSS